MYGPHLQLVNSLVLYSVAYKIESPFSKLLYVGDKFSFVIGGLQLILLFLLCFLLLDITNHPALNIFSFSKLGR